MHRVLIIASGAYLEPELEAEFGRVPPAFLPVGNQRLFVRQHGEMARSHDRIILSLPADFEPEAMDRQLIGDLGMEIFKVPPGLSLGQSLAHVIGASASAGHAVAVLHGDTLLRDLPPDDGDVISTAAAPAEYRWGPVPEHALADGAPGEKTDSDVLSGYFSFSDAGLFLQAVTRCGGDFVAALDDYSGARPLQPIQAGEWLDFGHASTFHRSRRRITTQREFNRLNILRRTVVKSGVDTKIRAEAHWFENLPPAMRVHAPAYLGSSEDGGAFRYAIEYLYLPTLSDLFVFGRLSAATWRRIFSACDEFLTACSLDPAPSGMTADSYLEKTMRRLERFAGASALDLNAPCRFEGHALPSLRRIAQLAAERIAPAGRLSRLHGDFCFSNILYDSRAELVRVIDPRGLDMNDRPSCHGDLRYDIAKLYHSVEGGYDHIIAGYYVLKRGGALDFSLQLPGSGLLDDARREFRRSHFAGQTPAQADAPAMTILLFLAMLPLHSDAPQRQLALLANALRLFGELDAG